VKYGVPDSRLARCCLGVALAAAAILIAAGLSLARWGDAQLQSLVSSTAIDDFSLSAIEADVRRYDQLGTHRTGSPGDLATTDWLESTLQNLGYAVRRQPFTIDTSIPGQTYLRSADLSVEAFPLFPVTATPPEGITGPLKPWERGAGAPMAGTIAVVDTQQSEHQGTLANRGFFARLSAAADSGASAVVVLTRAGCGTFQALNADLRLPPWTVPVVLVGQRSAGFIAQAIAAAEPVTLVSLARHKTVTAYNLIAEIGPAHGRPIVVSTPQSGWFHAAGERGSGMAAFLALARWAARQSESRFLFFSNSGHERGNAGARKLMESHHAPGVADTALWLHIGANIGTLQVPAENGVVDTRYAMANWFLVPKAWSLLRDHPGSLSLPVPLEFGLARGELADYHRRGYRPLLGIFGPSPYHHCANDRFQAVSLEETRKVALSLAALLSAESTRSSAELR
jgi:hypothetical protein